LTSPHRFDPKLLHTVSKSYAGSPKTFCGVAVASDEEMGFSGTFDILLKSDGRGISRRYLASTRNLALHQVARGLLISTNPFEFIKVKSLSPLWGIVGR
jgi:hypothetical protein